MPASTPSVRSPPYRPTLTDALAPDLSNVANSVDRTLHAAAARVTMGLSPAAMTEAYLDWISHLTFSPGARLKIAAKAARKFTRFANYTAQCALDGGKPCIEPLPQDRRFAAPPWQNFPFNFMSQAFLLNQQWWYNATTGIPGVTQQHENVVSFAARQILDVFSPSNFPLTNPEVIDRTLSTGGINLVNGLRNFAEDSARALKGEKRVGRRADIVTSWAIMSRMTAALSVSIS